MRHRDQAGFTLIEIMLVVAIIGILTAIAIPVYSSYREKANNSLAMTDVYHLFLFENQFFNENSEFVPVAETDKQANGLISKNVTLKNGSAALFEIRSLSPKTQLAVNADSSLQTIVAGGKHVGSTMILALDLDTNDGYHQQSSAGAFTASDLPAATNGNDLSSWPVYQK